MSHPRAVIPLSAAIYYRHHGLRDTCAQYGVAYRTMRRWLAENGVAIRDQGKKGGIPRVTE